MVFKFSQIAEILHFSWVDIFFRDCTIFDFSFQRILSSSRPWKVSELTRDNWPDAATDMNEHIRIATLTQRTTPKQQHWIYEHEICYFSHVGIAITLNIVDPANPSPKLSEAVLQLYHFSEIQASMKSVFPFTRTNWNLIESRWQGMWS